MLTVPAAAMLKWPVPNWKNPTTRNNLELYFASSFFLAVSVTCVFVRLYSRLFVRRYLGLDDVFIVLAFLFSLSVTALVAIGYHYHGWNRHIWDLPLKQYSPALRLFYWTRILWGQAASFARLSVICLYYRLVNAAHAPAHYHWVLHANTFFNVGLQLFFLLTGLFPCWPIKGYWYFPSEVPAKCINDGLSMQAAGVLNTFAEFVMALLPCIAVFKLKVDKRKRWHVLGLLSLGFLVSFVGIWRTFFIWRALTSYDLTWWLGPHWVASEIENSMALICACAVSIRPLAGRLAGRFLQLQSPIAAATSANSGISSDTTVSHQKSRCDPHQSTFSWTPGTARSVDLEGIADDGYGYTVKITSPGRPQRTPSNAMWRVPRFYSGGKIKEIIEEGVSKDAGAIAMMTEVDVAESWKATAEKDSIGTVQH